MSLRQLGYFLLGLVSGVMAVALAALGFGVAASGQFALPTPGALLAELSTLWQAVHINLRGSAPLFVIVLVVFGLQLWRLHQLLATTGAPMARILRHEQLLDLCSSLFFGIGVIWTAIGMRDALLFALGDVSAATDQGAFSVLQRMVDGGILLALSTTIVGGIGGYLMRAIKSVLLGQQLAFVYLRAQTRQAEEGLAALQRIEHLLHRTPESGREAAGSV